jgi:hypothetical protein
MIYITYTYIAVAEISWVRRVQGNLAEEVETD